MSKQSKCMVTISYFGLKLTVEADITDLKWPQIWETIQHIIDQYCKPEMKVESIIFFDDERVTGGIKPGRL